MRLRRLRWTVDKYAMGSSAAVGLTAGVTNARMVYGGAVAAAKASGLGGAAATTSALAALGGGPIAAGGGGMAAGIGAVVLAAAGSTAVVGIGAFAAYQIVSHLLGGRRYRDDRPEPVARGIWNGLDTRAGLAARRR